MTGDEVLLIAGTIILLALTVFQLFVSAYNLLNCRVSDSTPACMRFKGGFHCDYGKCKEKKCLFAD